MTLDLSAVTDSLIGLVKSQWTTAPIWTEVGGSPAGPTFTPNFTGLAPDAMRQEAGPQLSMYLYHVESDNAREALFWQPQMADAAAGEPARFLPLALDLYYLLSAYSETSYIEEQEAMSVALRIYHANPIVRSDPGTAVPWELTLTVEHRSYDELSRLWQATTAPLRMSLVYRAAVVFIEPDPMPVPAPQTSSFSVDVIPVALPLPPPGTGDFPVAFGTFREGSYVGPAGQAVPFAQSPATVAAGQTIWLMGSDLGAHGVSDSVYLLLVSRRRRGGRDGVGRSRQLERGQVRARASAGRRDGTGRCPGPGRLPAPRRKRHAGLARRPRTGSVPVSVAAFVDPAGGPVLTGSAPFTVHGTGFVPGATEVLVGTVALTETSASPGPGEVSVDASGTSFSFSPPAGAAGTVAPVRVRVSGIESDPALWVRR